MSRPLPDDARRIVITGASSGIGEATARELAATGARLFIGARRGERLKALTEELGETVAWRALDVTDGGDFDAFVVTPTTSRSTSFAPRRMISMWPSVIGSNVPG